MTLAGQLIHLVLYVFLILLLIRLVVSWIEMFARQWTPTGPLLVLLEGVYTVTDPAVRFFSKLIPPVRVGQIMLDLGFLVLFITIYVLMGINRAVLL